MAFGLEEDHVAEDCTSDPELYACPLKLEDGWNDESKATDALIVALPD